MKNIFIPVSFFSAMIIICSAMFPEEMNFSLLTLKSFTFDYFSWAYVLFTAFLLLFLLYLSLSKYGDIILGDSNSKPEFSFFTWIAMLFSTGMGIGFMFFGVAEPIMHLSSPVTKGSPSEAILYTIFHWALHPWAIYGAFALVLAFFCYRLNLPLSLKSILFPLLGNRIYGNLGRVIDIITVLTIIFGIVTTFGLGSLQLNAGLKYLDFVEDVNLNTQIYCIIIVCCLGFISVVSGLRKGIRILSNLNLFLVLFLLVLFIFFEGANNIIYLVIDNLGNYINHLILLSFNTFSYETNDVRSWFQDWTIFYWAWWVSWAPFVSLFIARISRGRSIREFILCVLIFPSLLAIIWFTVFGNAALSIDLTYGGFLTKFINFPETLLFRFLEYFPLSTLLSWFTIVVILLFFITSVDSGILVLNHLIFLSGEKVSFIQAVFWVLSFILLTSSLLYSGGVTIIQAITIIMALPLLFYIVFACCMLFYHLYKYK